jgi:hypothetical protein
MIDATAPISVTLEAQFWNVVELAVQELPWKIANPVLAKLRPQLSAAASATEQPTAPLPTKGNGADVSGELHQAVAA